MKLVIPGKEIDVNTEQYGDYAAYVGGRYVIYADRDDAPPQTIEAIAEDQLVELTFEDDIEWYGQAGELPLLLKGDKDRSAMEDLSTFHLPTEIYIDGNGTREGGKKLLKFFQWFKGGLKNGFGEQTAKDLAAAFERKVLEKNNRVEGEGLYFVDRNFSLSRYERDTIRRIDPTKPVFLMLHGTASHTAGSFGGFKDSNMTWENICAQYGDNILALEHCSLTKSPIENLCLLLEQLPSGLELHLLSQSRGGLVGELLCCFLRADFNLNAAVNFMQNHHRPKDELEFMGKISMLLNSKAFKVTKYIRVACPAAGTNLLEKRIDHVLNAIFILVKMLAPSPVDPIVVLLRKLVIATAQQRTKIDVLPGLESMHPDSAITGLFRIFRNETEKTNYDLYVVQGAAGPGDKLWQFMAWLASKYVFWNEQNDFVIDTSSMMKGLPRNGRSFFMHCNNKVHHLSYFANDAVQVGIQKALEAAAGAQPENFQPFPTSALAMRGLVIGKIVGEPDGSLFPKEPSRKRPIVVFLPGIMGSNLSEGGDEVWVNYLRIAIGNLTRLRMGNKITAKSVIEDVYGKFCSYMDDQGYDVAVFPYDWRLKIETLAGSLKQRLEELLKLGQPIQIIAHSMGGLLIKHLMAHELELWGKLRERNPDFRCILLGTPWRGSYLVPMLLTGHGRTINSLHKLDFTHNKQELLNMFVHYPSLYDLLPHEGHDFYESTIWEKVMAPTTETESWAMPIAEELERAKKYHSATAPADLSGIIYVAGRDVERTFSNMVLEDKFGYKYDNKDTLSLVSELSNTTAGYKLSFEGTFSGDGTVTWELGIPFENKHADPNLYFVDTVHMELANDPKNFEGLLELLRKGVTSRLPQQPPKIKDDGHFRGLLLFEPLPTSVDGLVNAALGRRTEPILFANRLRSHTQLNVRVVNGHLKHASHPIMVGHFRGDGIVSAEAVLDKYLDNALTERERLGVYPGALDTSLVIMPCNELRIGAIVIGMGDQQTLTPFLLSKAVERGCLDYMLGLCNEAKQPELGISSLLIGSGYANLSLLTSMSAIINGIMNANMAIKTINNDYPQIVSLELIELFKDKAETAYYQLHQLRNQPIAIGPLIELKDAREMIDLDDDREWWTRISALEKKDERGMERTAVSASNGRARVQEQMVQINQQILEALLEESNMSHNWDPIVAKALFELLVPNDFKIAFRNQQNMLWILDDKTARYPIELLHYDENASEPVGVKAGMIRQLAVTGNMPSSVSLVNNNRALVIGDPKLSKARAGAQLPEAYQEAQYVADLLTNNGYKTQALLGKTFSEIFKQICTDNRILHIASHGVVDFVPNKHAKDKEADCNEGKDTEADKAQTGILLSHRDEDIVLTPDIITAQSSVPELVFINCCHMGRIDYQKERYFTDRYALAANIGTAFIKKGARAVVVAGWAVNDGAARIFSETFYEKMLGNSSFGEAVRAAREASFNAYPNSNTWGAYQCYGDPYYRLERNGAGSNIERKIVLTKQALIELEYWMNKVNSLPGLTAYSSARNRLIIELQKLVERISKTVFGKNGRVLEMEAFCYAEIGLYKEAIDKFEELFATDGAVFTSRAKSRHRKLKWLLEAEGLRRNSRMVGGPAPDGLTDNINELKQPAPKTFLQKKMLADAYRRMASLTISRIDMAEAANWYEEAFKCEGISDAEKHEALGYMVFTKLLSADSDVNFKKFRDGFRDKKILKLLDDDWDSLRNRRQHNSFQMLSDRMILGGCKLLLVNESAKKVAASQRQDIVKQIMDDYNKLLRFSGSPWTRRESYDLVNCLLQFVLEGEIPSFMACKAEVESLHRFYKELL